MHNQNIIDILLSAPNPSIAEHSSRLDAMLRAYNIIQCDAGSLVGDAALMLDALEAVKHRLICESLSVCYAADLAATDTGKKIANSSLSALYPRVSAFARNSMYLPAYLDELSRGPVQIVRPWRRTVSAFFVLRNLLDGRPKKSPNLYYASKFNFFKEQRILSDNADYSIAMHAREMHRQIGVVYRGCWWTQGKAKATKTDIEAIDASAKMWSELIDEKIEPFLDNTLALIRKKALEYLFFHTLLLSHGWLNILKHNSEQFAQELWIGSGGNLWARMLGLSHKRYGRRVVGHAHAAGGAQKIGAQALIDLPPVTHYISHNLYGSQQVCQSMQGREWSSVVQDVKLDYLRSSCVPPVVVDRSFSNKLQKVLYVGTGYQFDNLYLIGRVDAFTMLPMVSRINGLLGELGWDMVYKPHPNITKDIAPFLDSMSVRVSTQPYEQAVLQDVDLVLFDQPASTTFGLTLAQTNLPVVLLDTPHQPWSNGMRQIIKKRCAFVPLSELDTINTGVLKQAAEEAVCKRNDRDSASTIFLNTGYDW